mgnify:CR=1 FL=1
MISEFFPYFSIIIIIIICWVLGIIFFPYYTILTWPFPSWSAYRLVICHFFFVEYFNSIFIVLFFFYIHLNDEENKWSDKWNYVMLLSIKMSNDYIFMMMMMKRKIKIWRSFFDTIDIFLPLWYIKWNNAIIIIIIIIKWIDKHRIIIPV